MYRQRILFLACLVLISGIAAEPSRCAAQMFGERSVGGMGLLQGNERFLRGNRSRRDFVGADRGEQSSFVGAQQALATGRVRAATEGLRIDSTNPARINRPWPPQPSRGMYYPRLQLDINTDSMDQPSSAMRAITLSEQLRQRVERIGGEQIELSFAGSTAILRGTVDSPRTARLLQQLLAFEPGVDHVENQLGIQPQ